jgi:hypothetical protein
VLQAQFKLAQIELYTLPFATLHQNLVTCAAKFLQQPGKIAFLFDLEHGLVRQLGLKLAYQIGLRVVVGDKIVHLALGLFDLLRQLAVAAGYFLIYESEDHTLDIRGQHACHWLGASLF